MLWVEVEGAAAQLANSGVRRGDRVLLALTAPDTFHAFFVAAQCLGAIPVPAPSRANQRVRHIVEDCRPALCVVEDPTDFSALLPTMEATELGGEPPASFGRELELEQAAFIQYTSGTTGAPRGAVITHQNLAANLEGMRLASGMNASDAGLSWLPLHHDMGLVGGLLLGLWTGLPTYVAPTACFQRGPADWLTALSDLPVTYTVAPNSAYALIAERLPEQRLVDLDLSGLRLLFNGAEPVYPETLQRLANRLRTAGLRPNAHYPVYGLAECTLAVTFPKPGIRPVLDRVDRDAVERRGQAQPAGATDTRVLTTVSVGFPLPGQQLTIRDREGNPRAERQVGEIWVTGENVSPRYFGERGQNRRELATGDLGYLADGQLFVIDRIKDVIIVGGINIYPAEVERAVSGTDGLRPGRAAAFGVPGRLGSQEVCLVAEKSGRHRGGDETIRRELRERVRQALEVELREVLLVPAHSLPLTTSGKIRRQKVQERFIAGHYSTGKTGA